MDKKEKATYLLYELNNIDDRLLEDALAYPAEKKRRGRIRLTALACAVLIAVMTVLPVLGVVGLTAFIVRIDKAFDDIPSDAFPPPKEEPSGDSFEEDLEIFTQPDRELFFRDTPTLIWQEEGKEEYHALPLTTEEFYRIERLSASSIKLGEERADSEKKIWICDGKGFVKTPYLEDTPGNLYYATLFDYDPEMILSDEFEDYLENLTS